MKTPRFLAVLFLMGCDHRPEDHTTYYSEHGLPPELKSCKFFSIRGKTVVWCPASTTTVESNVIQPVKQDPKKKKK